MHLLIAVSFVCAQGFFQEGCGDNSRRGVLMGNLLVSCGLIQHVIKSRKPRFLLSGGFGKIYLLKLVAVFFNLRLSFGALQVHAMFTGDCCNVVNSRIGNIDGLSFDKNTHLLPQH